MTLKRLAKSQRPSKARWISLSSHLLEGMSLGEHAAANGNKRTEISCVEQRALIIQWPMNVASMDYYEKDPDTSEETPASCFILGNE